jgi:phage/plasmid primase-like uncharacterized protein
MIAADLIERAHAVRIEDEVARRGIKLVGRIDRCGPCPQCGGHDRFSINVRKQVFLCRQCGAKGDVIALVRFLDGCGFREAVEYLTGERAPAPSRPAAAVTDAARAECDERRAANDLIFAKTLVLGMGAVLGAPEPVGYLRVERKIDTEVIADVLERVDAIGWHPAVPFREKGHPLDGKRLGCIIAVMTDVITAAPTGAISRTYIREGRKVCPAKTLGSPAGIVRLSLDEDVLEGLHIAEGLETALDVMAEGFRPCWSTGSTALMAKFPVLAGIECLTVVADHDLNGAGLRAASEAADRWQTAGRETHVFQRETPGDFNDAFREINR